MNRGRRGFGFSTPRLWVSFNFKEFGFKTSGSEFSTINKFQELGLWGKGNLKKAGWVLASVFVLLSFIQFPG